jgi:hypothetical protein
MTEFSNECQESTGNGRACNPAKSTRISKHTATMMNHTPFTERRPMLIDEMVSQQRHFGAVGGILVRCMLQKRVHDSNKAHLSDGDDNYEANNGI